MTPRGLFLSLDGIDGTGKSTQCRLLADWLRSCRREVVECADPGGTPVGQVIRDLLLDHRREMALPCEALLFMASRAQLVADIIRPALDAGRFVVSDRFLLANVVYQGHAGGLDPAELWRVGQVATGGLEPDLTLVLDLPVEHAQERRGTRTDRMEGREHAYHERVREGFLKEARAHPDRIRVIRADAGVEVLQARIRREVELVLETHPRP
jgi:dTMP kinase